MSREYTSRDKKETGVKMEGLNLGGVYAERGIHLPVKKSKNTQDGVSKNWTGRASKQV